MPIGKVTDNSKKRFAFIFSLFRPIPVAARSNALRLQARGISLACIGVPISQGHGCLLLVNVVCCAGRETSATADPSSRGVLPYMCVSLNVIR